MSVSKSVAGALVGRKALDVTKTVETIVPELATTSFAGAAVRQLLDMRTGTRFSEDYGNPDAEITVSDRVYLWSPDNGKHVRKARSSASPPSPTTNRTAARSDIGRSSLTCSPGSSKRPAASASPT